MLFNEYLWLARTPQVQMVTQISIHLSYLGAWNKREYYKEILLLVEYFEDTWLFIYKILLLYELSFSWKFRKRKSLPITWIVLIFSFRLLKGLFNVLFHLTSFVIRLTLIKCPLNVLFNTYERLLSINLSTLTKLSTFFNTFINL